jgi:hypothetical protein
MRSRLTNECVAYVCVQCLNGENEPIEEQTTATEAKD